MRNPSPQQVRARTLGAQSATRRVDPLVRHYATMAAIWWIGAAIVIAATVSATSMIVLRVRHARAVESVQTDGTKG